MMTGDVDTGEAILRDYIQTMIGFDKLGEAMGPPRTIGDFTRERLVLIIVNRLPNSPAHQKSRTEEI
jgi:hypothetical protein